MIFSRLQFLLVISLGVVSMAFGQNRFCRSINRMDCTKGFIPNVICGDDGVSYPNDCEFSKALCKNPDLKEHYKGECVTSFRPLTTTPGLKTEQPTIKDHSTTQLLTEPTTLEKLTTVRIVTQSPGTESILVSTRKPTTENTFQRLTLQKHVTDYSSQNLTTQETITEKKNTESPSKEMPLITESVKFRINTVFNFTAVITIEEEPETDTPITTSKKPTTSGESSTIEEATISTSEIMTTENPFLATTLVEESSTTAPKIVTTENMPTISTKALEITTLPFNPVVESFLCTWIAEKEVFCDPSHKDYACASDHKTYRTRCDLVKARCDFPNLHMVQEGICPGHKLAIEYTHHEFVLHIIQSEE